MKRENHPRQTVWRPDLSEDVLPRLDRLFWASPLSFSAWKHTAVSMGQEKKLDETKTCTYKYVIAAGNTTRNISQVCRQMCLRRLPVIFFITASGSRHGRGVAAETTIRYGCSYRPSMAKEFCVKKRKDVCHVPRGGSSTLFPSPSPLSLRRVRNPSSSFFFVYRTFFYPPPGERRHHREALLGGRYRLHRHFLGRHRACRALKKRSRNPPPPVNSSSRRRDKTRKSDTISRSADLGWGPQRPA